MDLTSENVIKNLLRKHGIHPLKRLGQNFLIDKAALEKIITAADLQPKNIILEIGPGVGTLTQELAKKSWRIIAVEKDPNMTKILKETLPDFKNIKLIQGDILKINLAADYHIFLVGYKIVANLPFYIVAPVIKKFLESKNPPIQMVLTVQKDVAQRIAAQPPDMNLLAVSVQFYAKPEIIAFVSRKSFWPQPEVDGAILKISEINSPFYQERRLNINRDLFFKIVGAGFSHPRKQIFNNLAEELRINRATVKNWLLENKIKPTQRAETLTIKNWINLTKTQK